MVQNTVNLLIHHNKMINRSAADRTLAYELVTLARWTLGLDWDPEKYTLQQLEAEFTYITDEESQIVWIIDS